MTKKEVLEVVYYFRAMFPHCYKGMTDNESRALLSVWFDQLEQYDAKTVWAAVKTYAATTRKEFPPLPSDIIDQITKLTAKPGDKISEGEAWQLCYKAICNSIYCSSEEFAKLPETVRRAVGSPEVLNQWAQIDIDSIEVIHSNFLRAFRIEQERKTEELKMPESVRQFLLEFSDRLAIDKKDEREETDGSERRTNADTENKKHTDGTGSNNAE